MMDEINDFLLQFKQPEVNGGLLHSQSVPQLDGTSPALQSDSGCLPHSKSSESYFECFNGTQCNNDLNVEEILNSFLYDASPITPGLSNLDESILCQVLRDSGDVQPSINSNTNHNLNVQQFLSGSFESNAQLAGSNPQLKTGSTDYVPSVTSKKGNINGASHEFILLEHASSTSLRVNYECTEPGQCHPGPAPPNTKGQWSALGEEVHLQRRNRRHQHRTNKESLSTPSQWKMCYNLGNRVLRGTNLSNSWKEKGYLPFGRCLFGSPWQTGSIPFILGTELPDRDYYSVLPSQLENNFLLFGSISQKECLLYGDKERDSGYKQLVAGVHYLNQWPWFSTLKCAQNLNIFKLSAHCRDMCWVGPKGLPSNTLNFGVVAGNSLSLIGMDLQRETFHCYLDNIPVQTDVIRSVTSNGSYLALGGFGKQVAIFDIKHLASGKGMRVTPEASYNCGAVLSSLSWRDPHVISYTVDQGRLELLDIRSRYTSLIMATETTGLYCHACLNGNPQYILMGHAGGRVDQVDIRMPTRSVLTLKTKGAFDVSDIYFTSHDSHMLLLGSKGFSIYQHVKGGFLAQSYLCQQSSPHELGYTVHGQFIPNTHYYGLVDSHGYIVLDQWQMKL